MITRIYGIRNMSDKTLQQILDEERSKSPASKLTNQQIGVKIGNKLWKTDNPDFIKNVTRKNKLQAKDPKWIKANKLHHASIDWNEVGKKSGKTRKEKGNFLKNTDPDAYRDYYGVKDEHAPSTKKKMSKTASERWSNKEARLEHSKRLKGIKKETATCKFCGKTMSKANFKKYGHDTGTNKCKGKKSKSTI